MEKKVLIPKLVAGQRSVIFAEASTGILLTPEGAWRVDQTKCYGVFDSEEEAMAFAQVYVEQHPTIECSIRDEYGNHLKFVRRQH